jgi:aryl-alcohol dehydrogenase-like predicted oxidoreductase
LLTPGDVLGPVLDTLRALRSEGKTRAIGCCAWGGELSAVNQVVDSGAFDTVLVGYSILNPTSGRTPPAGFVGRDFGNVIDRAHAVGTSAVVLKVLESGALSGATQPHPTSVLARRPNPEFTRNAQRARALQFLVHDGQTMVQAAIRYALTNRHVGVVLVGFSAVDQVEECAQASNGQVLSADDLARLEQLYISDFAADE